ncbi:MAG: flagellar motor protein MotB [Pseudomonadota bacterium]
MRLSGSSRKMKPQQTTSDSWMITFGDLIMLLLTFFVMLLTMKSLDRKDVKELFPHASRAGGPLDYAETGFTGNAPDYYGDNEKAVFIENKDILIRIFSLMKDIQTAAPEQDETDRFRKSILIEDDPKGVMVSFRTEALFEPGKAEIHPSKIHLLDIAGELLKTTSNNILILGHAGSLPPGTTGIKTSWDLALYRALHIRYYLTANFGMAESRLAAGGVGDQQSKPASEATENTIKQDRIEFVLMKATS